MSFGSDVVNIKNLFEADKSLFKAASAANLGNREAEIEPEKKAIRARRKADTWEQRIIDFEPMDVDPFFSCWFEDMGEEVEDEMDPTYRNEYFGSFILDCLELCHVDLQELQAKYLNTDEETRNEVAFFEEAQELLAKAGYYVYNSDTRIEVFLPGDMAEYDIEAELEESVNEAGMFKAASQDNIDTRKEEIQKKFQGKIDSLKAIVDPYIAELDKTHTVTCAYLKDISKAPDVFEYALYIDSKEIWLNAWEESIGGKNMWVFCVQAPFYGSSLEFPSKRIPMMVEKWLERMTTEKPKKNWNMSEAGLFKPADATTLANREEIVHKGMIRHDRGYYGARTNKGVILKFVRGATSGSSLSMHIDGDVLYSYATPIAFRKDGLIYYGDVKYSSTTSGKHQGPLRWMAGDLLRTMSGKEFAELLQANGVRDIGWLLHRIREAGLFKPASKANIYNRPEPPIPPYVKNAHCHNCGSDDLSWDTRYDTFECGGCRVIGDSTMLPGSPEPMQEAGMFKGASASNINNRADHMRKIWFQYKGDRETSTDYDNFTYDKKYIGRDATPLEADEAEGGSGDPDAWITLKNDLGQVVTVPMIDFDYLDEPVLEAGMFKPASQVALDAREYDGTGYEIWIGNFFDGSMADRQTALFIAKSLSKNNEDVRVYEVPIGAKSMRKEGKIIFPVEPVAEAKPLFKPASPEVLAQRSLDPEFQQSQSGEIWFEVYEYDDVNGSQTISSFSTREEALRYRDQLQRENPENNYGVDRWSTDANGFSTLLDEKVNEVGLFKPASKVNLDNRRKIPGDKRDPVQLAKDLYAAGFVDGIDADAETSLLEYGILRNPDTNKVIFSVDLGGINYFDRTTITYEDVIEALDGISDKFFSMTGIAKEEYLNGLKDDHKYLATIINDINMYNSYFTESCYWNDTVVSIRVQVLGEKLRESHEARS